MLRRRRYRCWSAEEKRSICRETRAPGVSVAQVARRHGLNANLIFKWLKDRRFAPAGTTRGGAGVVPLRSQSRGGRAGGPGGGPRPPPPPGGGGSAPAA